MVPFLWVLTVALCAGLAYARGHEHGVMQVERALRTTRANEPPRPATLSVRCGPIPLTLDEVRALAPDVFRDVHLY